MVFSSFAFLFRFLPVFLAAYYLTPGKYRNYILFGGSLIFYTLGEVKHLPLLLACVIINYMAGKAIGKAEGAEKRKRRRFLLVLTLIYDFGVLFFFKYSGLANTLPLGISFYTFQITGYILDVYRGKFPAEQSFLRLGTYLTMFSQIQSGPIVNYSEVQEALVERKVLPEHFEEGLRQLILGLGAKVLLADRIALLWNNIGTIGYSSISTPLAWMGAFAYSMQLYFDFAGYSMMVVGIGKMLGFEIPENFRLPYISKSVTEFWRRWHITLGRWFREYVYIPLGGNRKGKERTLFNLFAVWSLTALWHGSEAHFLIWGAALFLLIILEKKFLLTYLEKSRVFCHAYLLFVIPLTWVAFAVPDLTQLGIYFARLFPFLGGAPGVVNPLDYVKYLEDYGPLFVLGTLFASPLPQMFYEKIKDRWIGSIVVAGILAVSVYYLSVSANNPFLYFSF